MSVRMYHHYKFTAELCEMQAMETLGPAVSPAVPETLFHFTKHGA